MKKTLLIRLGLIGFIVLVSYLLQSSLRHNTRLAEQDTEDVTSGSAHAPASEFLIWESVTRYMMATYN